MFRFLLCLNVALLAAAAPSVFDTSDYNTVVDINSIPTPEDLAPLMTEDQFEDYLDYWLHQEFLNQRRNQTVTDTRNACTIPISSLAEPLPIYVTNNALIRAQGTTATVVLSASQRVDASCTGSGLQHGSSTSNPAVGALTCVRDTSVSSSWVSGDIRFSDVRCLRHPTFSTREIGSSCLGGGIIVNALLNIGSNEYRVFSSCFHKSKAEVFYVQHDQTPENVYFQPNVGRPDFDQGSHFPNLEVNTLYTQNSQKAAFDTILGANMNLRYINATYFLARGHLGAKTDFVFAPEQRATFTFTNTAPQWQPFNAGNWNTLEQRLRARIAAAGYRTTIYTGTHGILRLADAGGVFRDIYLSTRTNQLPVPMWFYKVVYEPSSRRGVVFLGLNNPHVTLAEARNLAFCTDICTGNSAFSWLTWNPTNIGGGFGLCCAVDDFRRTVTVIPPFTTSGILS